MSIAAAPLLAAGPPAAPPRPRAATGAAFEARLSAHLQRAGGPAEGARPPLEALLRATEAAQARLDRLLASARDGRALSAGDLLVLQAEAYRCAQVLEVAGKAVEQGVQSVKQAIQTPI